MFRDASTAEPTTTFWQAPQGGTTTARAGSAGAFAEDEVDAVSHVYREIARRIRRNAYTRHASTLGNALR